MQKLGNVLIHVMQDLSKISTNGQARISVNTNICDPETFRSMFAYFTQGTILEHLDLEVESMQPTAQCACGYEESIEGDHDGYIRCPDCGKYANIEDDSYSIHSPDPEKAGLRKSRTF
jgi:Zn finger protein HypA/HybF involved in hydrogenase expression